MKLRIVALIIFLLGSGLLAGSIMKAQRAKKTAPTAVRSFVVQYLISRSENGGSFIPYEYDIRAVSSTGEWKETRYSFDNKVSTWGGASDGLYMVSGGFRQYFGDYDLEFTKSAMRSEEEFKTSPQFIRVENLLGLTTYVLKDDAGSMEIEISSSPETGITPLKKVIRSKSEGGKNSIDVKEAINIQFRDLSEDEARLPDLPIRFDVAEQKMQSFRAAGQYERAEFLEQAIKKIKGAQK